jgi:hypothetical protein
MVAVAGASLVGGAVASKSAKSAANTQAAAADRATQAQKEIADQQVALQREQFNRSIDLQEPFRQSGLNAQNRLNFLLGLSPLGSFSGGAPGGGNQLDPQIQAIRNRLMPQYVKRTVTPGLTGQALEAAVNAEIAKRGGNVSQFERDVIRQAKSQGGWSEVTREADLEAAVRAELAKSNPLKVVAKSAGQVAPQAQGGEYGSLMRDFAEPAPEIGDFSMADFQADPGYAFRQSEGEKALQRAASAGGLLGSGSFLKDAMRFNQGLATDEYGRAFDRCQVNRNNKVSDYQNAFNRFQINRSNKLNPLQALAGVGQTATNTISQAGQNFASGAGNALGAYGSAAGANIIGAGNAAAAGKVGSANAWNNAIGQAGSMYQQNQMMNRLFPTAYGGYGINGGGGFGTGAGFGNQDYGQFL